MFRVPLIGLLLAATLFVPRASLAQVGGGVGGGLGGVGGGFGGGGGGAGGGNQNSAGIKIDPQGVLSLVMANDGAGLLDKKRREAVAKKFLSHDVNQPSEIEIRFSCRIGEAA